MNIKLDLNNTEHRSLRPIEHDQPESITKSSVWQRPKIPYQKFDDLLTESDKDDVRDTPIPDTHGLFYSPYFPLVGKVRGSGIDGTPTTPERMEAVNQKFDDLLNANVPTESVEDDAVSQEIMDAISHNTVEQWWQQQEPIKVQDSAFDVINTRLVMTNIRTVLSELVSHMLCEFNDDEVREEFREEVKNYLDGLVERGAITDFTVICDSNNNPPEIVATNKFVADIFVKPVRTVDFIKLNFVASATSVDFDSVIAPPNLVEFDPEDLVPYEMSM